MNEPVDLPTSVIREAIRAGTAQHARYERDRQDAYPGGHTVGLAVYEDWVAAWPLRQKSEFIGKAVAKAVSCVPEVRTARTALGGEVETFDQYLLQDSEGTVVGTYATFDEAKDQSREGLEIVTESVTYTRSVFVSGTVRHGS